MSGFVLLYYLEGYQGSLPVDVSHSIYVIWVWIYYQWRQQGLDETFTVCVF